MTTRTTAEALGTTFTYNGKTKLGRNCADLTLEWYVKHGSETEKTAAILLLADTTETISNGAVTREVKQTAKTPPPPDDDGFGPLGATVLEAHKETPARVMPKALVTQPQQKPAPLSDEWVGFEDGDSQETGLAVSTHQELAPSIRPVGVESLPDFDNMQQDIPLNMKKFEFSTPGQELRGLYIGIQKMQKNGKSFDSAVFQRKDGLIWAAGVDLTSKLAPIPTGTPVLVRFQGTKNLGNGNRLSLFDVFSLK